MSNSESGFGRAIDVVGVANLRHVRKFRCFIISRSENVTRRGTEDHGGARRFLKLVFSVCVSVLSPCSSVSLFGCGCATLRFTIAGWPSQNRFGGRQPAAPGQAVRAVFEVEVALVGVGAAPGQGDLHGGRGGDGQDDRGGQVVQHQAEALAAGVVDLIGGGHGEGAGHALAAVGGESCAVATGQVMKKGWISVSRSILCTICQT